MEAIPRFSHRLVRPRSLSHSRKLILDSTTTIQFGRNLSLKCKLISNLNPFPRSLSIPIVINAPAYCFQSRNLSVRASWLKGFGEMKKPSLPDIVKAGDPVLHEPAQELDASEIRSERIQKIIDDMIKVMRKAPGVGLAAPQIGIPLKVIVLEDTREYISYAPKDETKAQERRPFDLLVLVNPKLETMSNKKAIFFEGCLSVDGYRAAVERFLEVEVSGLDRYGKPIKVNASGWQARILQHECDHLDGTLYVDKMVKRTFRIVENLDLPLAGGCPKLGACCSDI